MIALVFCASALLAIECPAAIQLEGVATYQVFPNRGSASGGLETSEHFEWRAEGRKWWIETRRILFPDTSHPLTAWPVSQQAGSDGTDIYYHKILDAGPNPREVAWILTGNPPRTEESPVIAFLWLACCAGNVLTNQTEPKLQWPWSDSGITSGTRPEFLLPVHFVRSDLIDGCLDRIEFIRNLEINRLKPGETAPAPVTYTGAVYRVESTTRTGDGPKFPTRFSLQQFSPRSIMGLITAVVTNTAVVSAPARWLPQLPQRKITVQDFRPKISRGADQPVLTEVTGSWPGIDSIQNLESAKTNSPPIKDDSGN